MKRKYIIQYVTLVSFLLLILTAIQTGACNGAIPFGTFTATAWICQIAGWLFILGISTQPFEN